MPPKVSVLIPVFNRKHLIAECIQSALDQTFTDFEIVIVDNASSDGTWEICQRFAKKDPRVRVFRNNNNIGPVRNWKRCAKEARGEFSKILFSDDTLETECLAELAQKLDDPEVSLVYCAARIGLHREDAIIAYSLGVPSRLNPKQFLNLVLSGAAPVSPGAIMIRTKDLLKNLHENFPTATYRPFENHGAGPDVMISLLTVENHPYVAHVPSALVYFRAHEGSFSIQNSNNHVQEGYVSAICYYLAKSRHTSAFIKYTAKSWLIQIRHSRSFINPRKYLIAHEGSGSPLEILSMLSSSAMLIGKKLASKFITAKKLLISNIF